MAVDAFQPCLMGLESLGLRAEACEVDALAALPHFCLPPLGGGVIPDWRER